MKKEVSKDTIDYVYLSDSVRYADLFNGALFGGKQVLDATYLEERDTKAVVSKRKTKARDLIRKYSKDAAYVVLGVENQEEVNYIMPLRMQEYEVAEYRKQVAAIKRKNSRAKAFESGEFLEGYKKTDFLSPCVSMVLFWGRDWEGPECMKDMFELEKVPKQLREYVNDYRIHVVNVRKLEDTSVFRTDLRQVFDFIRCFEDKAALKKLVRDNPDYASLEMEAYDIMTAHAHSKELEELRDKVEKEGGNMCKGLADWAAEERAEGREEGRAEAMESGLKALINTVKDFCGDFEALYSMIIVNECYKNVTREQVKKYV